MLFLLLHRTAGEPFYLHALMIPENSKDDERKKAPPGSGISE
jgi:hypothetical protein